MAMPQDTTLHVWSIDHHRATTDVREKVHLSADAVESLLATLAPEPGFVSALPVSTCNRTEIYLETNADGQPAEMLGRALTVIGLDASLFFGESCQRLHGPAAVAHLFRVASGLESMMLGEPQIFGQLKDAYRQTKQHHTLGPILVRAFQGAFRTGKRVRTETRITCGAVSVAFAAVELAKKFFDDLSNNQALLVGAGETGALAARHFLQQGIGRLTVINRSGEKAEALAESLSDEFPSSEIKPCVWGDLTQTLGTVDVVLSTTGALEPIILPDMVREAVSARNGRPLFLLDIAVPRDIHPDATEIDGAYAYGLDDLDDIVSGNLSARRAQIPFADKIIQEELNAFQGWLDDMDLRPTVAEFRTYLEDLKDKQVGFVRKQQSDEVAEAVDSSLQQFIKKVLGRSVSSLKQRETKEEQQRDLAALRRMFSQDTQDRY